MFEPCNASLARRRAGAMLLVLAFGSGAVQACRRAPEQLLVSAERQLAFARDVSVARVVSAVPIGDDTVEYRFVVERRLAGPASQHFTLHGVAPDSTFATPPGDRADHDGLRFWARGGGRLTNDPACVLRPWFTLGEHYLVILDQPYGYRSFEHIATVDGRVDANDKWLAHVQARLGSRMPRQVNQTDAGPAPR